MKRVPPSCNTSTMISKTSISIIHIATSETIQDEKTTNFILFFSDEKGKPVREIEGFDFEHYIPLKYQGSERCCPRETADGTVICQGKVSQKKCFLDTVLHVFWADIICLKWLRETSIFKEKPHHILSNACSIKTFMTSSNTCTCIELSRYRTIGKI